jgi:hypothetical protein
MLYYAPPPLPLAPHISVAPRAGIRSGVMRNLMILALTYTRGGAVWPMMNSIFHGNVLCGNVMRVVKL